MAQTPERRELPISGDPEHPANVFGPTARSRSVTGQRLQYAYQSPPIGAGKWTEGVSVM